MKLASIDIGTNTILLLVAEAGPSGSITTLAEEQRFPRLGKDVDASRRLSPESMRRAVDVLKEYREVIGRHRADRVTVVATSAVRDASNRSEFSGAVKAATGFELEVLSGDDEARWTYRGAVSGIPGLTRAAVLDIGGGSTEFSLGDAAGPTRSISMDIGSVRLTERFLRGDPPSKPELDAAAREVRAHLEKTELFDARDHTLVAAAGTATSLAVLAQGLQSFSIDAVTNFRLTRARAGELLERLSTMTTAGIRGLSEVMEGRADVMIAGTLILREVMNTHGFAEAIVSARGVRYGMVIRELERLAR
jgi:exopolyphosphatase/guanosine-5'-triphosphate,3'-diphosphate pyrophosphatase